MERQVRILRSLLTQLDGRRVQDKEEDEAPDGIAAEFARLKSQSTKYRADKTYPTKAAEKQENIKKNRYKDIVPFDHTRVKLTFTTNKKDTDYINASFIKGVSESKAYIATQGPLPHTVVDFLRMLWEHNVKVVVMACREVELGKKKCELYWPQKEEKSFSCEPFTVYCDSEENKGDYLTRTLRLTYRNCSRTLKQLHYVNWPDHGVPNSIPPILDMLDEMRSYQDHDDVPICVHCSAGCGRTGALCVIDYTWNLLKKQTITEDFSIFDLVQNMRTQRPSLVQTKEQYELVYRTIRLLFQTYLDSVEAENEQNVVTMAQPAITESQLSDLQEEIDTTLHFQNLLDEERDSRRQTFTPSTTVTDNLTNINANHLPSDQQLLQTSLEDLPITQEVLDKPRTPPKRAQSIQRPPEFEGSDEKQSLNPRPSPSVGSTICLLVEDPYFDSPLSSLSSEESPKNPTEEQWTSSPIFSPPALLLNDHNLDLNSPASGGAEEIPPPLPERTPESYVLVENTEDAGNCEMLSVVIPPNAAAEAVREFQGSPPSPVPPLPERTPESFQLATDIAPVEEKLSLTPAVNLNRIGSSSEWSGNANSAADAFPNNAFSRSKSLKLNMAFTAPATQLDSNSTLASNFPPSLNRLLLHRSEKSLTPPPLCRNPEEREKTNFHAQSVQTSQIKPGISCEWDGTSQPKLFDAIMNRSKSVRAKSSRPESLTVPQQLLPFPAAQSAGGSAQTERSGNALERSSEKEVFRKRSLKIFRPKSKPQTAPSPSSTQPEALSQPASASFSPFKFGFGKRFGKPKGPRKYPDTWL